MSITAVNFAQTTHNAIDESIGTEANGERDGEKSVSTSTGKKNFSHKILLHCLWFSSEALIKGRRRECGVSDDEKGGNQLRAEKRARGLSTYKHLLKMYITGEEKDNKRAKDFFYEILNASSEKRRNDTFFSIEKSSLVETISHHSFLIFRVINMLSHEVENSDLR